MSVLPASVVCFAKTSSGSWLFALESETRDPRQGLVVSDRCHLVCEACVAPDARHRSANVACCSIVHIHANNGDLVIVMSVFGHDPVLVTQALTIRTEDMSQRSR